MCRNASFALLLAALAAGCALIDPTATPMGGSGIEGSGLAARPTEPRLFSARRDAVDTISVETLDGEAFVGRALAAGDRFAVDETFELRSGEARLRVPGDLRYVVTGPARVRFVRADGRLAAWLESGSVQAPAAGRVVTPGGAALVCETTFRATRDRAATTFDCPSGSLSWGAEGAAQPIAGSGSIDEASRAITAR
jgi:hypothetical protein